MSGGAFFVRRPGAGEPTDAASPLDGYEFVGFAGAATRFVPDGGDPRETTADELPHLLDADTVTATIEHVDEGLMRRLSGWTVLMTESEATRLRTFHRVYTWDYEKMRRDGSRECPVHPPTLVLPYGIPSLERAISAWLDIEESPGRDFAYVSESEPDVLRIIDHRALCGPNVAESMREVGEWAHVQKNIHIR